MTLFLRRIVLSLVAVLLIPVTLLAEIVFAAGTAFPIAFLVCYQTLRRTWCVAKRAR